jgi:hypothetical protein
MRAWTFCTIFYIDTIFIRVSNIKLMMVFDFTHLLLTK